MGTAEDNVRIERVRTALGAQSYRFTDEAELQEGIAEALAIAGLAFEREAVLSPKDRVDFLLPGGLVIEVKIDGSISALTRQVFRYTELDVAAAVVVVASLARLCKLPEEMNGKPVRVFCVKRAFQ